MRGRLIEELAWPEVEAVFRAGWPALLPIGAAAKEHGRHLPLATDRLTALALGRAVAAELRVAVLPVVDFGYYPAFTAYAGSQSISPATFVALLVELMEGLAAQGARRIAILNTGVSTEAPVALAQGHMRDRHGLAVPAAYIRDLGRRTRAGMAQKLGGHADQAETAMMLAIAPDRVRMDRAAADYGGELAAPTTVFRSPARLTTDPAGGVDYSPTGARGDPALATRADGEALLAEMVAELVAGLRVAFPDIDALPDPL